MVFFPVLSPNNFFKNILKLGPKIYILQFTLHIHTLGMYILDF